MSGGQLKKLTVCWKDPQTQQKSPQEAPGPFLESVIEDYKQWLRDRGSMLKVVHPENESCTKEEVAKRKRLIRTTCRRCITWESLEEIESCVLFKCDVHGAAHPITIPMKVSLPWAEQDFVRYVQAICKRDVGKDNVAGIAL